MNLETEVRKTKKIIGKAELNKLFRVANKKLLREEADNYIECLLDIIYTALKCDRDVQLTDIGRLTVKVRKATQRQNPTDRSKMVAVPARKRVTFKASKIITKDIN